MLVATNNRGASGARGVEVGQARDPYIRVHQVLQIHHATAPSRNAVSLLDEPETLDDCLIAMSANIARHHLKAPFQWVNYDQVESVMEEARRPGSGKNYPYTREQLFAPIKVVLAEAVPIRAVLTFEPCYPWQAKLATRVPGQRLWMVYAAVAVLNSRFGKAYYSGLLARATLKSATPHGLKISALRHLPVARAEWEDEELGKVVDLTHQLIALYEGREECLPTIRQHARARPLTGWQPTTRPCSRNTSTPWTLGWRMRFGNCSD